MAWLIKRDEPQYSFNASSISQNFSPFQHDSGADDVEDRIIAPVRDKSRRLQEIYIRDTYAKAEALVRNSDITVAVGYSFNPHDGASYQPILRASGQSIDRRLLVVSPDAGKIADAIRPNFPTLSIRSHEATFKQWVTASFPGLDSSG